MGDKVLQGGASLHQAEPFLLGVTEKFTDVVAGIQGAHQVSRYLKGSDALGKRQVHFDGLVGRF